MLLTCLTDIARVLWRTGALVWSPTHASVKTARRTYGDVAVFTFVPSRTMADATLAVTGTAVLATTRIIGTCNRNTTAVHFVVETCHPAG